MFLKLVKTFQVHSYFNCKHKKNPCKFHYRPYFKERTIISKPLLNVTKLERFKMPQKRINIEDSLDNINSYSDPSKNLCTSNTCKNILNEIGVT